MSSEVSYSLTVVSELYFLCLSLLQPLKIGHPTSTFQRADCSNLAAVEVLLKIIALVVEVPQNFTKILTLLFYRFFFCLSGTESLSLAISHSYFLL